MAGKKMKKMESCDNCDDSWMAQAKIKAWVLIILGLLGLLEATGYIGLRQYYFAYVWSAIVLIIGINKLWYMKHCK